MLAMETMLVRTLDGLAELTLTGRTFTVTYREP